MHPTISPSFGSLRLSRGKVCALMIPRNNLKRLSPSWFHSQMHGLGMHACAECPLVDEDHPAWVTRR